MITVNSTFETLPNGRAVAKSTEFSAADAEIRRHLQAVATVAKYAADHPRLSEVFAAIQMIGKDLSRLAPRLLDSSTWEA